MEIIKKDFNNIKSTFIKTDKFKTIRFRITFEGKFDHQTATKRSLLAKVLSVSSQKYPTKQQMTNALFDLYDASYSVTASAVHERSLITFHLEIVNEKFLFGEDLTIDALDFLSEVIFKPFIEQDKFNQKVFNEEKRLLEETIKNIYNNKNRYAIRRLLEEMCSDEVTSISPLGSLTDLSTLSSADLYQTYLDMINNDNISVYAIGDFDVEKLHQKLTSQLKFKFRDKIHYPAYQSVKKIDIESKQYSESQDINQSILAMGFRTNITPVDKDYLSLVVFNTMYGGLFNSNLFTEVREKNSLAYMIASFVSIESGLLIVNAGLDLDKTNQAMSMVIKELRKYQDGKVDEELFLMAKENIINDFKELEDSPSSIINFIQTEDLYGRNNNINNYIQDIEKVTVEDIINVSKLIELDTIFILEGDSQHESN